MSRSTEVSAVTCSHHGGCARLGDGARLSSFKTFCFTSDDVEERGCGETARGLKSALQRTCKDLP
jgi:hypothetical protein